MWQLAALLALAQPPAADWQSQETPYLKNTRQVTHGFVRAGEGYFSPDGKQIIFQGEEKGENPFFQMFIMDLESGRRHRISPGVGKTTCGFFHPSGKKVIWASTHLDPEARSHYAAELKLREEERKAKKRRRYLWDFDPHMDIFESDLEGGHARNLTHTPGYDAEGSYSADGKSIVFCSNRTGPDNLELYVMDADGKNARQLTHAPGCYNGGPFFSPDGKRVIFRSDRKKKDHLQLYVINADGTGERALTDDLTWVFWAPYWHRDGKHIIYTAADHGVPGRPNYDLYWRQVDGDAKETRPVRLTFFPGADILPVFSPDGRRVLWTSTRDGSSQLWVADFVAPEGN